MNDAVTISVIIPCYNSIGHVGAAIQSVLAQNHGEVEAVVVDDGSTDGTYEMLERDFGENPHVRLLSHPGHGNRGVSNTRALGMQHSTGEHVAFLDADDLFAAHKIERQMDLFRKHPAAILCHSAVTLIYDNPADAASYSKSFRMFPDETVYQFSEWPDWLVRNPICNSSVMVRSEPLKRCFRGFDQVFQFEDWLLWVLLSLQGSFVYTPEPLTQYRYHAGSATARIVKQKRLAIYSHIEFLIALMAHLPAVARTRFESAIGDTFKQSIQQLAAEYTQDCPDGEPEALASVLLSVEHARLLAAEGRIAELESENDAFRRYYSMSLPRRLMRTLAARVRHEA